MKVPPLLGAALLVAVLSGCAFACSCSPEAMAPACEKLATAEVVFVGTVMSAEPDPQAPGATRLRVYRFRVETTYKGLSESVKHIVVNPDNFTSCQTLYGVGKRYLVFARHLSGTDAVLSGACHGSRLADYAKQDIQFLEAYRLKQAGNSVYGRVLQSLPSVGRSLPADEAPVGGASVILSNGSSAHAQRTSAGGEFRFHDIPPGSYTLSARMEPYIPNPLTLSVEVPAVGCVERFPVLEARAQIAGQLIDESGNPVPRQQVQLLRKNRSGAWYASAQFWTQTNRRGEFTFKGLPDGAYLLGHEIWGDRPSDHTPYPTTYFPSANRRADASVIHLYPLQTIGDLRIQLKKPHQPRSIRVEVVWPDGRTPGTNLLQLSNGEDLIKNVGGALPDQPAVRHNGIVEFVGFAERQYDLNVRYWVDDLGGPVPPDKQRVAKSQVVRLPPGREPASVKLILGRVLLAIADR